MFNNYEIMANGEKRFQKHKLLEKFQFNEITYSILLNEMRVYFKPLLIRLTKIRSFKFELKNRVVN